MPLFVVKSGSSRLTVRATLAPPRRSKMDLLDALTCDDVMIVDYDWDKMAATQPPVTADTLREAQEGSIWCLMDRNSFIESNWRRIFATRYDSYFRLHFEDGRLINEPSHGVPDGTQSAERRGPGVGME